MIKTIIIADNLVNDYCSLQDRYLRNNVHIGVLEAERLFGTDETGSTGPLPVFLKMQEKQPNSQVIYVRDYYVLDEDEAVEQLERLGHHCIKGSSGEEFVPSIKSLASPEIVVNNKGLSFPVAGLQKVLEPIADIDFTNFNSAARQASNLRFLLVGFHTERRISVIASILRNLFQFSARGGVFPFSGECQQRGALCSFTVPISGKPDPRFEQYS